MSRTRGVGRPRRPLACTSYTQHVLGKWVNLFLQTPSFVVQLHFYHLLQWAEHCGNQHNGFFYLSMSQHLVFVSGASSTLKFLEAIFILFFNLLTPLEYQCDWNVWFMSHVFLEPPNTKQINGCKKIIHFHHMTMAMKWQKQNFHYIGALDFLTFFPFKGPTLILQAPS